MFFATIFSIITLVLTLLSRWFLFEKYNEPGWAGLIPIYSDYVEYSHVWPGNIWLIALGLNVLQNMIGDSERFVIGMIEFVIAIAVLVIECKFSYRKSLCFGAGMGMTILLLFFPYIGNLVLGLSSKYEYYPTVDYRD